MNLQQLVYVSRATTPVRSVMDVSDILEASVRNNPANNITGALAFTETHFVQLLEGSAGSIDVLLLKLLIDSRHFDLVIIDRIPLTTRSFAEWSMVSPVLTPLARDRLIKLVDDAMLPIEAFRQLMLDMVAEQATAVKARFAGDHSGPTSFL